MGSFAWVRGGRWRQPANSAAMIVATPRSSKRNVRPDEVVKRTACLRDRQWMSRKSREQDVPDDSRRGEKIRRL